jgi:hypothetical protein
MLGHRIRAFLLQSGKKMKVLQILVWLFCVPAVVVPAHGMYFEHVQDFETVFGPLTLNAVYVRGDFDYTHELSGVLDGYQLDNAFLELAFTGDFTDFHGNFLWFDWDFSEIVDASFSVISSSGRTSSRSIPPVSFGEVDNGTYSLPLQADGLENLDRLKVYLDVYNDSGVAGIFLQSSRLYGDQVKIHSHPGAPSVHMPIPSALHLLSAGCLLLAALRNRFRLTG